jgi:hypothetical protein
MHYQRIRDKGEPGPAEKLTTWGESRGKACSVEGCPNPVRASGWCEMHYKRNQIKGDPGGAEPLRRILPEEMQHYTPGQRHRFYKYGLTDEAFNAMLASQDGRCYICRTDSPNGKGWSVDHCHETNAVRFIACNPCNAALGLIREDPDVAKRLWEVAIECQARKGAELRVADLVEWAVSAHPDFVQAELEKPCP